MLTTIAFAFALGGIALLAAAWHAFSTPPRKVIARR